MIIKKDPKNGIFVLVLYWFLNFFGFPMDCIHEKLKILFVQNKSVKKIFGWDRISLEGVFVELWLMFWTVTNTFLYYVIAIQHPLWHIALLIMFLRFVDFLRAFLSINLELMEYPLRSISRSYILLGVNFFEVAAISSAIQFIICDQFLVQHEIANWKNVYYYSLRNMLTIGGGDIEVCNNCSFTAPFFFGVIRIAQPLFAVLLVTLAINQTLKWGKRKSL
jgi:hypothetical protein